MATDIMSESPSKKDRNISANLMGITSMLLLSTIYADEINGHMSPQINI